MPAGALNFPVNDKFNLAGFLSISFTVFNYIQTRFHLYQVEIWKTLVWFVWMQNKFRCNGYQLYSFLTTLQQINPSKTVGFFPQTYVKTVCDSKAQKPHSVHLKLLIFCLFVLQAFVVIGGIFSLYFFYLPRLFPDGNSMVSLADPIL